MHNLVKIRIFRILLWITYPLAFLLLYPFVLVKKKNKGTLFFFFDRYSIGGAQRVHLDILESVHDLYKQVYFTRKSPNQMLKKDFFDFPNCICFDIHFWCDNLVFRLFSVHYFAFYINKHASAKILSSNSTFFYDMLPFLKKRIQRFELLHNFSYGKKGMEFFGLANFRRLDKRLVIDGFTRRNIEKQYQSYKVDPAYFQRVQLIEFGVEIPTTLVKNYQLPFKVLYAGRGGPQKRVWLIDQVASFFINLGKDIEFHFAGTMLNELSPGVRAASVLHGEIGDKRKLQEIFRECHALLLTSSFEGFPMVVKEAMAFGIIPIVTALEGNKTHLKHLENALLIDEIKEEDKVVETAIHHIKSLKEDPMLWQLLSRKAYEYAKINFTRKAFLDTYRALLQSTDQETHSHE